MQSTAESTDSCGKCEWALRRLLKYYFYISESVLCDLFPGNRVPRFFRVSKQDESSFPASTFDSLGLDDVSVDSDDSISVKWHVGLGFYYSDYDWGLIFRRIGDVENPNMFFKTR